MILQAEKAGDKAQDAAGDAKGKAKDAAGDVKGSAKDAAGIQERLHEFSFHLFMVENLAFFRAE